MVAKTAADLERCNQCTRKVERQVGMPARSHVSDCGTRTGEILSNRILSEFQKNTFETLLFLLKQLNGTLCAI